MYHHTDGIPPCNPWCVVFVCIASMDMNARAASTSASYYDDVETGEHEVLRAPGRATASCASLARH